MFSQLFFFGLILFPVLSGRQGLADVPSRAATTRQVIMEMALESLERRYGSEEIRFSLSFQWIPNSLSRMDPSGILSVEPLGEMERYTLFEVECLQGGRTKRFQIQFAVEMEQMLPVAIRRIQGGEILRQGDLEMRWVPVAGTQNRMVRRSEEVEGMVLRRTLAPGQPIRRIDIGGVNLIEAGDSVTLIYEQRGIRVELPTEARQGGGLDEEIRVYSSETRRKYVGRVVRPGVAVWQQTL